MLVAAVVLCVLPMVVVHELGHVAAARLAGDPAADFVLYQRTPDGWMIGYTSYDSGLFTPGAQGVVNLAGVTATSLAGALLFLLRWRRRPGLLRTVVTGAAICFAADLPAQCIQGALSTLPYPSPAGVDLAAFATGLGWATHPGALRAWLLVSAALAVALLAGALHITRPRNSPPVPT